MTENNTINVVAVSGDWHGDFRWANQVMQSLGEKGVKLLLHVGDFGIWPDSSGKIFLQRIEALCAKYGMTVLVTPGNHEDWARLDSLKPTDRNNGWGKVQWLNDHIGVLPRSHRFTVQTSEGVTRSFVSLGGAPSVDYYTRSRYKDWWPSEVFTDEDVDNTVAGGFADIMLTHDSPNMPYAVPEVEHIVVRNEYGWPDYALAYVAPYRRMLSRAFEGVRPRVLFHGHYHTSGFKSSEIGDSVCSVVCLDESNKINNTIVLNLNSLKVGMTSKEVRDLTAEEPMLPNPEKNGSLNEMKD